MEIPNWLSDGQANDAPKEHLLGLIRQETLVDHASLGTDGGHALTISTKFLRAAVKKKEKKKMMMMMMMIILLMETTTTTTTTTTMMMMMTTMTLILMTTMM